MLKGAEVSGEKTSSYPKTAVDLHRFGQKTPCSKILYTFNYLFTTSKTIEVEVYSTSASREPLKEEVSKAWKLHLISQSLCQCRRIRTRQCDIVIPIYWTTDAIL